jgi:hypothetical protein
MKKTTMTVLSLAAAMLAGQAFAADTATPPADTAMPHPGMHRMHKGMGEADANKDGNISKDEFRAQGDKMFDKLDTNHDGTISKDEREARRKEFEAKRTEWKAGHPGVTKPSEPKAEAK